MVLEQFLNQRLPSGRFLRAIRTPPPPHPDTMDFSDALKALKDGKRVTRFGWNGAGMFVVYQKGYPAGIPINSNTAEATGIPEGTVCSFLPYLMMRTAHGAFVPWLASQTDLLADDWSEV